MAFKLIDVKDELLFIFSSKRKKIPDKATTSTKWRDDTFYPVARRVHLLH